MPPALDAMVLDLQSARPAARTDRPLATQRDRHDHRPLAERHIPDPCARKPEHPVECRRDPHVALLRRQLNPEHSAACRSPGGGGSPGMCATCEPLSVPSLHQVGSGAARHASSGSPGQPILPQPKRLQEIRPLDPGLRLRDLAMIAGQSPAPQIKDPTARVPPKSPPNDEESPVLIGRRRTSPYPPLRQPRSLSSSHRGQAASHSQAPSRDGDGDQPGRYAKRSRRREEEFTISALRPQAPLKPLS